MFFIRTWPMQDFGRPATRVIDLMSFVEQSTSIFCTFIGEYVPTICCTLAEAEKHNKKSAKNSLTSIELSKVYACNYRVGASAESADDYLFLECAQLFYRYEIMTCFLWRGFWRCRPVFASDVVGGV